MSSWEDDYDYHSTNRVSQVEGGSSALPTLPDVHESSSSHGSLHASNPDPRVDSDPAPVRRGDGRSAIKTNGSLSPCLSPASARYDTIPTTLYYFGEGSSGNDVKGDGIGPSVVTCKQISTSCDRTLNIPPAPPPNFASKLEMPRSKTALHQMQSTASPTKKLAWDQGMLSSLVSASMSVV